MAVYLRCQACDESNQFHIDPYLETATCSRCDQMVTLIESAKRVVRRERIAAQVMAALVGGMCGTADIISGRELAATAVSLADDLAAALDGPKPAKAWDNAPLERKT